MEIPGAIRLLHAPLEGHEGHRKAFRAAGRALFAARARAGAGPADADSSLAALTAGAVFESVTRDPVWLAELTGAPPPALRAHLRALRFTRILALRRHAAAAAFENMAYAAADLDPQRLHAAVEEQMLEQIRRQEVRWPADPFWVERPMFHAAAILAELGAAQLLDRMREKFPAPAGDPGAGEWLRARLFDADHALDGPALVEAAAGGPLGLGAFAQENDLTMEPAALAPVDEISDEAVAEYFKDIDLSDLDRS